MSRSLRALWAGQLPGLRGPEAVESRPPGRSRRRPRSDRPADAHRRHRGRPPRQARVRTTKPDPTRAGTPIWSGGTSPPTAPEPAVGHRSDATCRPGPGWPTSASSPTPLSRMIVGWRVASHMRTTMVLDAIEMARWSRGNHLPGLRVTPTPGRNSPLSGTANGSPRSAPSPRSARSGTATITPWPRPSTALQGRTDPRARPRGALEDRRGRRTRHPGLGPLAQHSRLHGYLDDLPPAEFEATFYAAQRTDQPLVEIQ